MTANLRHTATGLALVLTLLFSGPALSQDSTRSAEAAVASASRPQDAPPLHPTSSRWLDAWRLSGYLAVESRLFLQSSPLADQESGNGASLVLSPELYREWSDGDQSFTFEPYLRLDSIDGERTHFDLRELSYTRAWPRWELTLGISRVFWGVTESQHLVDIVNQTDLVENPDGEDKLGQPMIRATAINSWGIVDVFVLPGFRERTFPGQEGRLRPGLPIDQDSALYESSAEQDRVDWALRWSRAIGAFDLGLSHFSGTSREPLLVPSSTLGGEEPAAVPGDLRLIPYYPVIRQTGVDLQATLGSWLLKLETIRRTGFGVAEVPAFHPDYTAATYGFEYTFWSAFDSKIDVGLLAEHLWDERGELATTPFQDDLFAGTRIAFNDSQSSEILGGMIYDLDNESRLFLLEAKRRIGSDWVVELEFRGFSGQPPLDPLASLRADDYLQLSLQRHF